MLTRFFGEPVICLKQKSLFTKLLQSPTSSSSSSPLSLSLSLSPLNLFSSPFFLSFPSFFGTRWLDCV
ncbi:hypothetical protein ACN38_g10490 [Penicillium nordicum]|uniref:Uncharacterized protein n=1 Tax=Penicillium nordicum TaxID=229535 RepID=A0A0M8P0C8_9EURO|nr:hypothetical protein ACN38_g10490 [Penicillium nordicum]